MTKKPAPLDTAAIEAATQFDATIFLGTGRYHTGSFDNLKDARDAARQFGGIAKNGRKGMVYAVSKGRTVFVPDDYEPAATNPNEGLIDMTTNLSSTQIAQLTAIMLGEAGYKRASSKEAAIKRFQNVAIERGFNDAAKYLAEPFDVAEHCLYERMKGGHASIAEVQGARDGKAPAKSDEYPAPVDAKAEKPAKAAKAAPEAGKRAAILAAAERGELPAAPDFSAETHKRFRPKLAEAVKLAEAGDLAALEALEINPVSSSPKAIAKYRDLAIVALKARASKVAA